MKVTLHLLSSYALFLVIWTPQIGIVRAGTSISANDASQCVKNRGWYPMTVVQRIQRADIIVYGKILGSIKMDASGFFRTDMHMAIHCVLKATPNKCTTALKNTGRNFTKPGVSGKTKILIEMVKPGSECTKIEPDRHMAIGNEIILFLKCLDNGHFKIHEVNQDEISLFPATDAYLGMVSRVCGVDNGFGVLRPPGKPNFQCPVPAGDGDCISQAVNIASSQMMYTIFTFVVFLCNR